MFGENEVNDYHLLKYSLLYDFFAYFSSIQIYGLPLAQCLSRHFLIPHIQPFVDRNLNNSKLISGFRKQHRFLTMGDINETLISFDKIPTIAIQKNNNSVLLSDDYYSFAADQLKEFKVTLYGVHFKEMYSTLPPQFNSCILRNELVKVSGDIVSKQSDTLKKQVDHKLRTLRKHYYFSTPEFQKWISKAYKTIIRWVYVLDQLILSTRPSVIINPSEASVYGTILGLLSKKYNIPFINMPITTIGDLNVIPSRADYYFVWGDNQKNWFIKRKIKDEQIIVTGNIKFYYEKKNSSKPQESITKEFNIPNNHHIIGFTSQPFLNTNETLEQWINAIPSNYPITIIIKKHRNDKYEYPLLRIKNNVKILSSDYPLYDFLNSIECLMTINSTTSFEAAILNKPLLILQPDIPYHYVLNHNQNNAFLAQIQAGEIIKNSTDLIEAVSKLTTDLNYKNHLKRKVSEFCSETIKTVDQAPKLVKKGIKDIVMKNL